VLGQILVDQGALSARKLEDALREQRRRAARGAEIRLGELLLEMRAITPRQLLNALAQREKVATR